MADMVVLKCDAGSRAATVVCPACGRISRQILAAPFSPNLAAGLIRPHICPICGATYNKCDPGKALLWSAAFARYNLNADAYNQSVKESYSHKSNTDAVPATMPVADTSSKNRAEFIPSETTPQQVSEKKKEHAAVEPAQVKSDTFTKPSPVDNGSGVPSAGIPYTRSEDTAGETLPTTSMPVAAQEEPPSTPDEALDRKITHWKKQLLDTGKRNKMINFRETKRSTLRILEPEATELFNDLAFSEKPLTFQKPINKDTDLRTYSVIALMETLSYTLNVQVGDIKTAGTIIEREKTLKNLRSKAKLAQQEQGTNILYLCFGFIYWRAQNRESSPWFKAPLLMMPATIGLKSLNAPYTLSRYDDEIEVNPTLDYLFNTEYHIDLPAFELKNRQSFDDYFALIEEIVDKRAWKVVREVSLGLLSFLKISMYHDLNNNRERIVNHPVLRAMAGDRLAIGELPEQADHFDFDAVKPDEWHEVIDADSSQEEAILLSKLGVSFVVQGPPGTGKSQTITNIIAEALADGKKVLFVSEKAAALQVVLKRLAEVGLDDFCLSLHNYRANKKEIIDSIGANLSLPNEYIDGSELGELTELFHDRAFLNAYAGELHKAIAPLNQSVYMVFGHISKLEKATALDFSFKNPTDTTKEQLNTLLYCISAFETALHNMGGRLSANPWHDTRATSSGQTYKAQLLHDTEGLSDTLRKIAELANHIDDAIGAGKTKSFADVRRLLAIAGAIESKPAYISSTWFDRETAARVHNALTTAHSHSERLHQYRNTILSEWDHSVLSIDCESIKNHFCGNLSWIYNAKEQAPVEARLDEQRSTAEMLLRQFNDLLSAYHEGLSLLSYNQADTIDNIRMAVSALDLIASAPYMQAAWFDVRKNAEIAPLIDEAAEHSEKIAALSADILNDWEPSVFEIDADGMLARFKTEYVGMFHTLKAGYKEDIKTLRLHAKAVGSKIDEGSVIEFLQRIKELNAEKAWFDSNSNALIAAMGNQYHGETTEWTRVRESMSKALEITDKFPYSSIPGETVSALLRVTDSMQLTGDVRRIAGAISDAVIQLLKRLEQNPQSSKYITGFSSECDIRQTVIPQIEGFIDSCTSQLKYVTAFTSAKKNAILTYEDIIKLLSNLAVEKEEEAWFAANADSLSALIFDAYKGEETAWGEIEQGLTTAERLSALFEGAVPAEITDLVCGQKSVDPSFQMYVAEMASLVSGAEPKLKAFSSQFVADDFHSREMVGVAEHYDACMDGFGELNKWLDYAETREECNKHGLADFTAKIAALDNTVPDVKDAFERSFYIQWLTSQLDTVSAVQGFRRRIHEQRSERFVRLDTKQYEIARKRIRKRIIRTYPNLNRISRAGSELGILQHEMDKKRRIMPLRRLFQSIPNLLLTLKPCLMMSPLSVAYFLDSDAYQFDMVIFDEASQIFPQDAIGAIFRAKQVVIAGDTKQLPPTNFFSASTSNSSDGYDDDEGYDEEVYDSILEEAANILPNRTLLWHYRSKHEHLIAFSNQEIYKNELVTFPSSNESEPDTGVEFVYVEDGYYEPSPKNYNILEARRIVDLVEEHIKKHPDRSLGIIAFSEKQQQAIALEIQRFRESHSEYEDFFAEGKEDEFFVKNLENVQGDERDTIYFSVGYAKTKEQKINGRPMSMRFGPLGVAGGERRLNVAITRAKINVKLVSSILPSDIDLSRTESDGIRMLRSYIEFAMNGESTLAAAHRNNRPDDFADTVAQFIRNQGFKVKQYVGCSGYKIDIAVQHSSETIEQFVAGVECDGFSYVSAKTARDRDRLRSSVLKNMGWNLYRVWSAEWYKNPEIEGQKLAAFLQSAVSACDEKIKILEEQKRKEEEAKRRKIEEAKAAHETEERRKQEQVENAALLRAEREAALKREAERKRMEEQRARAARAMPSKAMPQKADLSWVKVGSRIHHNHFGAGTVLSVSKDTVKIRFGTTERTFLYPDSFVNGILTKPAAAPEPPKAKVPNWAVAGAAVSHKVFGIGVIETVDGNYIKVRFSSAVKSFVCPDAFTAGHLTRGNKNAVPGQMEISTFLPSAPNSSPAPQTNMRREANHGPQKSVQALMGTLRNAGFRCIDNRTTSSILWVLYEPAKKDLFEKIIAGYNIQYKLERRGALATNNAPAWRIMFN